jgi:1A family penicillin-binding protein
MVSRWLRITGDAIGRSLAGRPRVLTAVVLTLAFLFLGSASLLAWFSYDVTEGLPNRRALRAVGDMMQATTLYDAANQPVFTIYKEQRIEVPLQQMSPNLVKAVLSVEDQRFYDHLGVDAFRVVAAAARNIQTGRRAEGGSTITQQLARLSFLSPDKTYRRKAKEMVLAAYLESYYSKDKILEMYLNKVYLGEGYYGVEAASLGYFGKSCANLDVAEAALIAGLIQSPSAYAPTSNLEKAVARRNVVLQTMVAAKAIDEATAAAARAADVKLVDGLEMKESYGLYFKEHVRRELIEMFGWDRVYRGGLRVYTTMDSALQKSAEQFVETGLRDIEKRRGYKQPRRGEARAGRAGQAPDYLQGALVSIDPATGFVRAMVGGRDFRDSRFNRAVQGKRQAGSAFKPLVYAAAIEAGYSPATVISNLNDPIDTLQGAWVPEDEHSTATAMTMRAALKTSSNRAAVQMLNIVGIPAAVSFAEKLNVGTPPSVPSLALGASDVTLLALTSAYGAFAAAGVVREPIAIRRVDDNEGHVLYEAPIKTTKAVSESTAFIMSSMLADVVNSGTGYRVRQSGFTLPAAGKTGTTNDYVDAWFVGYTPHLVTGVWVGFDRPRTIVANGYGGELAVPIWAAFMKTATAGDRPDWFTPPPNVVAVNVCRGSGQLPNVGCGSVATVSSEGLFESRSQIYTEYFVKGTEPRTLCPIHTGTFYEASPYERRADLATDPASTEPPPAGTSGELPPVAPPSAVHAPPATASGLPEVTEEQPRRGFWSRLFRGNPKPKTDKKTPPPKKKPDGTMW